MSLFSSKLHVFGGQIYVIVVQRVAEVGSLLGIAEYLAKLSENACLTKMSLFKYPITKNTQ